MATEPLTEGEMRGVLEAKSAILIAESTLLRAQQALDRAHQRLDYTVLAYATAHGMSGDVMLSDDGTKLTSR